MLRKAFGSALGMKNYVFKLVMKPTFHFSDCSSLQKYLGRNFFWILTTETPHHLHDKFQSNIGVTNCFQPPKTSKKRHLNMLNSKYQQPEIAASYIQNIFVHMFHIPNVYLQSVKLQSVLFSELTNCFEIVICGSFPSTSKSAYRTLATPFTASLGIPVFR